MKTFIALVLLMLTATSAHAAPDMIRFECSISVEAFGFAFPQLSRPYRFKDRPQIDIPINAVRFLEEDEPLLIIFKRSYLDAKDGMTREITVKTNLTSAAAKGVLTEDLTYVVRNLNQNEVEATRAFSPSNRGPQFSEKTGEFLPTGTLEVKCYLQLYNAIKHK